jgi:GAF domain-containing protein
MGRGVVPADEAERIAAVRRYDILDTPPDEALDRIAALAATLFDVPLAVVSIVDTDRVCFTARHGVDLRQVDRGTSLCAAAILGDGPHVIPDAQADSFARANPLVEGEFGLRFYAGVPLTTHDGYKLGMLCVMDTQPRPVTEHELRVLAHLAGLVVHELEVRRGARLRTSTMDTRHAEVSALLGVYAVGACDADTAARVQEHLAVCVECVAEDRRLRAAASWIGGVDAMEPPPELRRRIAERLDRDDDGS